MIAVVGVATAVADDKEERYPKLPVHAGKIDKGLPRNFTATKSGLKYRVLRKGEGDAPTKDDTVEVHYHGWLDNGKVFDTTYVKNKTAAFPLKRVIAGWTEGMQLVGKGGMIELDIPSELGYGDNGAGEIPPKARLHFLVEIIDIKK
jgi:FKBP-type peptidyl-prolyl cis-trans isomerase